MVVSLDTNIWIFGLLKTNPFCEKIVLNVSSFKIVVPDQIRAELERNLSKSYMKVFYQIVIEAGIQFDIALVPQDYIIQFQSKGLKKGDAVIGAFCEWRKVDIIVSHNRDFLRGLSGKYYFTVMSPQEFCQRTGL